MSIKIGGYFGSVVNALLKTTRTEGIYMVHTNDGTICMKNEHEWVIETIHLIVWTDFNGYVKKVLILNKNNGGIEA